MGSKDKIVEHQIKEIHGHIKKSNLILKQKFQDIQLELKDWQNGLFDENHGDFPMH